MRVGIKRTVAITGGSGFIGKLLVEAHRQRGDEVRVLTRGNGNHQPLGGVLFFVGDLLSDTCDLTDFLQGADVLYHCAGELHNEQQMESLHVDGTRRLLQAAVGQVGRWVQLSSVGAYGSCREGVVDETSLEQPQGIYERSKTEADQLVRGAAQQYGLQYAMLRPSIVFGESMTNRSLVQMAAMIRRGMFFYVGSGARVNYVHVDDVVAALILCGERDEALGRTYVLSDSIVLEQMVRSLADGMGVKVPELRLPEWPVRLLAKLFGKVPRFPLTESRLNALTSHCRYDSMAIHQELGFTFDTGLDEAFCRYARSLT